MACGDPFSVTTKSSLSSPRICWPRESVTTASRSTRSTLTFSPNCGCCCAVAAAARNMESANVFNMLSTSVSFSSTFRFGYARARFLLKRHNMKNSAWGILLLLTATTLLAQHRVDIFVDAEGVRRNAQNTDSTPGIRFDPSFDSGGGVGGGINYFLTDRVSLEAKVSGLASKMRVRVIGSDFVAVADLGYAQIYPISAILQWHLLERGAIRPYIGAGVSH